AVLAQLASERQADIADALHEDADADEAVAAEGVARRRLDAAQHAAGGERPRVDDGAVRLHAVHVARLGGDEGHARRRRAAILAGAEGAVEALHQLAVAAQ